MKDSRIEVSYNPERVKSRSRSNDTDHKRIRSYRLQKAATDAIVDILDKQATRDLLRSLSACVGHARWLVATQSAAVTPREIRAAAHRLQRIAKAAAFLANELDQQSYAMWTLESGRTEKPLEPGWRSRLREDLTQLAAFADEARTRVGTYVVKAEADQTGRFVITGSRFETSRSHGRRSENERNTLASMAAWAFVRQGIPPTKARNGRFERVLRVLMEQAGLFVPSDLHRTVFRAVDTARWTEAHRPSSE